MEQWKKSFQIAGVYLCIILGAGFASGQEIINFFTSYGKYGFLGLVLSGILFALSAYAVLDICHVLQIRSYSEFMEAIMGKTLGKMMEILSYLFLFLMFCTMLAGSGAIAKEGFHIPYTYGVILMGIAAFVTFLYDLEGLVAVNSFLAPFLVVSTVFIGIYAFYASARSTFLSVNEIFQVLNSWYFAAILYVSYNIITAISVLTEMGYMLTDRGTAKKSAYLGGAFTALLAASINLPLFRKFDIVKKYELPLLHLSLDFFSFARFLYLMVLVVSIFTTAIAAGFSLLNYIGKLTGKRNATTKLLFVIVSAFISHLGFSNFVGKIYPLFGYLGLFELVLILFYFAMYKKTNYQYLMLDHSKN